MSLLSNIHLTPFVLDARTWVLSSSGVFSIKSFFSTLSFSPYSIPFYPTNFLWKSRVPFKVRAFAWSVVLKKVNTNDMLQLRRPFKVLSYNWYILSRRNSERIDHLFLHCPITLGLWHRILSQSGYCQVVFVIWRWSPSSVLWIQLEVGLFGGSRISLCCRLYEEKVTLGFSRTLGGCTSHCGICFIPIFLFGFTVQKILNPTLWALFNLVGSQFVHLMNGLQAWMKISIYINDISPIHCVLALTDTKQASEIF